MRICSDSQADGSRVEEDLDEAPSDEHHEAGEEHGAQIGNRQEQKRTLGGCETREKNRKEGRH